MNSYILFIFFLLISKLKIFDVLLLDSQIVKKDTSYLYS